MMRMLRCYPHFLVLLVLCCVLSSRPAQGQRAIVSLGKKLKRHFDKTTADPPLSLHIGTHHPPPHTHQQRAMIVIVTVVAAMLVGCVLIVTTHQRFTHHQDSSSDGENIIVKDDRVAALGGLDQVDLAFEDVRLELTSNKGTKMLLDGSVRGRARPGRMLAIMGPSGAGKSTLLHALAGRIKYNPKLKLYGTRYINGEVISGDSMIPAAFVEQGVNFFPHMTVRETLKFRVELKLASQLSRKGQDEMVDELIKLVGLSQAADTIVGDDRVRGISGGEQKRLSIAVEMISAPAVIFLDEPTSGLDSTAATTLVQTLRDLADAGKTVVAVIHQPSQHVFAKFDDVLLVSEAKQLYFGEMKQVRGYMEAHGCRAPTEIGTAEHILDCITRLPLEAETEFDADSRIEKLAMIAREVDIDLNVKPKSKSTKITRYSPNGKRGPAANMLVQFKLLLKRAFQEVLRGKAVLAIKAVQQISLAFIYGGIYSLGNNQASIQDRFGLLSLIAIGAANMSMAQVIRAFPKEKAIVAAELASKMYRTLPYFVGKALSDLPLVAVLNGLFGSIVYRLTGLSRSKKKFVRFLTILGTHGLVSEAVGLVIGAISPNSDVALALFPAILVLNLIFDGRNISEENTPRLLKWVPKLGLIRWGFEGLAVNEFEGLTFTYSGPPRGPIAKTGDDALARFSLGKHSVGDVIRAQLMVTSACWVLSFLGLTLTKQRFLEMKNPERSRGSRSMQ